MSGFDGEKRKCSFCGSYEDEKIVLISGPNGVNICNQCIDICTEQIDRRSKISLSDDKSNFNLLKPHEINEKLNEYVIGQEQAKKVLSVAVYNHYKRINSDKKDDDVTLEKSNVLMLGPTGSGKTLIAKTLASILNVPFAVADATTLTQAGYVGEDVENILLNLIKAADFDIAKAEVGIVYVDEIDKLASKRSNVSITRDVSGEGVQQALLKIIEGTVSNVPPQGGRKHPQQEMIPIDTTNILFICGGAFVGLEKIVAKRKDSSSLGFGSVLNDNKNEEYSQMISDIQPNDLINFGLIPEFVGRLPITVGLNEITEDALFKILTEPKNSLVKQYTKLLKIDNVDLILKDSALREIAKKAIKLKTGARGLRSIFENIMLDILFDIPKRQDVKSVTITKEVVLGKKKPLLKLIEETA